MMVIGEPQRWDIESQGYRTHPLDRRLRQVAAYANTAKKIYHTGRRYAPAVIAAAQEMVARGRSRSRAPMRKGRKRSRSVSRGRGLGGIITTQRDGSTRYVNKGKGPSKWRKFVKKVTSAVAATEPPLIYTCNGNSPSTASADQCAYDGVCLLGVGVDGSEVTRMFADAYGAGVTSSANINAAKLLIKNQCLDVEITNTGSYMVILDVYEVMCRKTVITAAGIGSQYNSLYSVASTPYGTKSANEASSSPFSNPAWCKYWKILKKTEIRIGVGEVVTMQQRYSRNFYIKGQRIATEPAYLRGARGYFFHYHGAPELIAGPAGRLAAVGLTVCWQKQYVYGKPPGNELDTVRND